VAAWRSRYEIGWRPEPCRRDLVWQSATQRLFVLVLCFHRHSRFVPLISRSTSVGIQKSRSQPPPSGLRHEDVRPTFGLALQQLSDFLYLSFVFIDILALFRRIQVEKSRVESRRVTSSRHPTVDFLFRLHNSSTSRLLNSSTVCFHRHSRFVPTISQSIS
jgi:hypothetical protein